MLRKVLNIIGACSIIFGILYKYLYMDFLSSLFSREDLITGAFILCGILMLLIANIEDLIEYLDKKNMSKEKYENHIIEKEDERNQLILIKSKSRAFDIMNIIMFIIFFALTLLGELSFFSFMVYGIALLASNLCHIFIKEKYKKEI